MSPLNENRPKARVSQDKNVKVPGRSKPYLPIHRANGIRKKVEAIDHAGRIWKVKEEEKSGIRGGDVNMK